MYLLCVQAHIKRRDTYLYLLESYWSILNLSIFAKGNLLLRYISPSTWGNQRGARELSSSSYHHQGENNGACACGCKDCYFTQSSFNAVVCCFGFTLWVGF